MKLYTEEQVKEAMIKYASPIRPLIAQVLDGLTPIELPSDEEIAIKSIDYTEKRYSYKGTFQKGAKWMKEKILNQNK